MNPYTSLDERCYWAPAVGRIPHEDISMLWKPKRDVKRGHKIATYGSCFAQHFGRALRSRKYGWMDAEECPSGMSEESTAKYNYGVFTSRTGNIYTTSLLRQWTEWALGKKNPPSEVWVKDGRIIDPFRPNIEPNGFDSEKEMFDSRNLTIESFLKSFSEANLFVFTLGLTESWKNIADYEYPICPRTIAGEFDKDEHIFVNHKFRDILGDLRKTVALMRGVNPKLRVLLTVSPVPLTATMSGNHVLTATVESKSILRAVAGEATRSSSIFDYFPSFEIISGTPFQGVYYNSNKRTVRQEGVDFVMSSFFDCLNAEFRPERRKRVVEEKSSTTRVTEENSDDTIVCEEELLAAFDSSAVSTRAGAA